MSWIMPFPESTITGEYGTMSAYRKKNGLQAHSGTDWAPAGSNKGKTIVPAIADGKISLIHYSKFLGWVVVQSATDKAGKTWYIGYCHLKCKTHGINCKSSHAAKQALDVKLGDVLKAGDTSHGMTLGTTGISSSGVHLHATVGKTVKSVFGMTRDKSDLKKLIQANSGPSAESKVKVELEPKNGNVVVKITGIPKGSKLRLRKDGASVWFKTIIDPKKVQTKGVTLTGKHVLSVEMNDSEVFSQEVEPQAVAPKAPKKVISIRKSKNVATAEVEVKGIAVSISATPVTPVATPEPVAPAVPVVQPVPTVTNLTSEDWMKMQNILKADHGYFGAVDGIPGSLTYKSLQRSVVAHGYTGPIDGKPGANTYKALQKRLVSKGTYEGRIDGALGAVTYTAWKKAIDNNSY
tara:strand:- start:1886 stop:3106 length:1221 start_codon:yes stop_codon:yes gene_type:complete